MSFKMLSVRIAAATAGLAALVSVATADQLSDIVQRKELRCGTFADVPPFAAPDPKTREMVGEVLTVMRGLARDGMTMMCVTHEMTFAREVADRVWFMDAGRVLETATPQDFFRAPQHPRAQRFLSDLRAR